MGSYRYMRFKHVILLMLATLILSIVAMPLYDAGVAVWDRQQFYEEMRTNPAYSIVNEVEVQFAYVTVLAVVSNPQITQVWMAFNIDVTEDEALTAIAYVATTTAKYYVSEQYFVAPIQIGGLRTVDGLLTYIYSNQAFGFSRVAIEVLTEQECNTCVLGALFEANQFQVVALQAAPCPELLQREPGYVWPWE